MPHQKYKIHIRHLRDMLLCISRDWEISQNIEDSRVDAILVLAENFVTDLHNDHIIQIGYADVGFIYNTLPFQVTTRHI